jgi:uncharacterized protein YbcC (UPF0753/DUF2309 family)
MSTTTSRGSEDTRLSLLDEIIHEISHYLPSQGPIKTFVHHNTLHYFEGQEFFDAIDTAADIYGAQTALPETTYQDFFAQGRIKHSDINRALIEYGLDGTTWSLGISKRKVVRSLLFSAPVPLTNETLRWRLLEKHYLDRFHEEVTPAKIKHIRDSDASAPRDKLYGWLASYEDVVREWNQPWLHELIQAHELGLVSAGAWSTHDSLKLLWIAAIVYSHEVLAAEPSYGATHHHERRNSSVEELVNPYLIKFTSTYLDTGFAHLGPTDRTHGLLEAFLSHMANTSVARPAWLRGDTTRFVEKSSLEVIQIILDESHLAAKDVREFLLRKALILKGWAGLVYQSERGVAGMAVRATVSEFLAVRLVIESLAEAYFAQRPNLLGSDEPENSFELHRPGLADVHDEAARIRTTAYHLFHAFQLFPCSGSELLGLDGPAKAEMVRMICQFDSPVRCRVWHKAYEWNLYSRAASALLHHNRKGLSKRIERQPLCQLITCIDDREESFRRYIEEISPDYETFGTAGFFGVDAEFHSLYERPAAFCPVNIVPTHHIQIKPKEGSEQRLMGLQKLHTLRSDIDMFIESQSRSLVRGWLLALGGLLALFPLSLSTLAPRLVHRFNLFLKKILINPTDESAIVFADDGVEHEDGRFTLDEMVHRVRTLLVSSGLSKRIAPLVVVMGHGSFSTNNPFRSAYDCGACGGRPGRMNPRVFAMMANRADVRAKVCELGIEIPDTTTFLGAFHNTCTDEVEYFDLDQLNDSNAKIFEKFSADVDVARAQNALERCRRFDDTDVRTVQQAIAHVESRAHHIAQPRPEYGHATNAMCFVGRRAVTKGLFLDRRSFLVSYDPEIDHELSALRNLLRAVIPVCMGINLEYFFSALDNQKYGAGTKLPHNVTSLLGLMTGYCSDLRTGLPAQMVEIHEPVRLLIVIEQSPEKLKELLASEPELLRVIDNHWVTLMTYSAEANTLQHFDYTGSFVPFDELTVDIPTVSSSLSWVLGKKDHLDFVRVG